MGRFVFLFLSLLCSNILPAQEIRVTGRVTDARTGEAIPFVNVYFTGTTIGQTTDFEGKFSISTSKKVDSVSASYLGYATRTKAIAQGKPIQTINFQLTEDEMMLDEIVIVPGENPAHRIIKGAQNNRWRYDMRELEAYEWESFSKVQFAIDNLSEKHKQMKIFKAAEGLFDTISSFSGEEGKAVLPIFISETLSDMFVTNKPYRVKEFIKANRISGVGVEDGSFIGQLLGASLQQYNFFKNRINILDKDFISPIADGAIGSYVFTLRDSTMEENVKTYRIQVNPKVDGDLAFTGYIWITDESFALVKVDLNIGKRTNLNFLKSLKIQQEMGPATSGHLYPSKTRLTMGLDELTKNSPGMTAIFYISNRNVVVNNLRPAKFYEIPIEMAQDAKEHGDDYWEERRHESITDEDKKVFKMVDTLRNLPMVKTYVETIDIIVNGYKKMGKIDLGPYALIYGYNVMEGHRFRAGFRTNADFSRRWILKGYLAYGTLDQRIKGGGQLEHIVSRKKWTTVGYKYKNDVEQIGITDYDYGGGNLFTTLSIFRGQQLNRTLENMVWVRTDAITNWRFGVSLRQKFYLFETLPQFNFGFYSDVKNPAGSAIRSDFNNTTLAFEIRYARNEIVLQNDNERVSLGTRNNAPIFTLNYLRGLKGTLDGDFAYDQINLSITQRIVLGALGYGTYTLAGAKIFQPLPYPLLTVHRGNQTIISSTTNYNLMQFFEFVTDQHVSLNYEHHLEGLISNRLPAIKRLNWRFFIAGKGIWGSISDANLALIPPADEMGRPINSFSKLNRQPYIEVSYGVENIFRILRIDFIHRLTHWDNPEARRFGVKGTLQFVF